MTGTRLAAVAALLAAAALAGCGGEREGERGPEETRGAIVRVGDEVLDGADLAAVGAGDDREPLTLDERRDYVRRWVDTQVLYQEAVRRGVGDDPQARERLRELERQYLADRLVFTELRKRTRVTDEEVEAYFAAHEREYLNEYRVSQILLGTPEEARQALERLRTKSFESVADRLSIDPAGRRGGDLGYLTKGNMMPELEAIVFSMKPGDVSGVVKSDFGWHIFKLVDVREALVAVTLDDVREQIMNALLLEKRRRAYDELLDSLRARARIEYRDPAYAPGAAPAPDTLRFEEPADSVQSP